MQAPPTLDDLVRVTGVPLQKLDEPCSDEHLITISSDLTQWRTVAPYLGLKESDIEEIETDARTESQKRSKALRKWKNKYSFKATYRVLMEALLKCHMADRAEKVCHLLSADPQEPRDSKPVHDENTSSVYVESNIPTTAALVTMAQLKYTVVQECFDELADGIQIVLLSVARKAFQEKVIPHAKLKVVQNERISEDSRATTLISVILDQIRQNERVYDTLLSILQAEPAIRWLADNLSKHLQKLQKASNSASGTCTSAASITTSHEPGVSDQEDGDSNKKILRPEVDSGVHFSNSTCSDDLVEQEPEFVLPPAAATVSVTSGPQQRENSDEPDHCLTAIKPVQESDTRRLEDAHVLVPPTSSRLRDILAEVVEKEGELEQLKDKCTTLTKEKEDLERKLSVTEKEIEAEKQDRVSEVEKLKQEKVVVETELEELKTKISKKEAEISELKQQLKEANLEKDLEEEKRKHAETRAERNQHKAEEAEKRACEHEQRYQDAEQRAQSSDRKVQEYDLRHRNSVQKLKEEEKKHKEEQEKREEAEKRHREEQEKREEAEKRRKEEQEKREEAEKRRKEEQEKREEAEKRRKEEQEKREEAEKRRKDEQEKCKEAEKETKLFKQKYVEVVEENDKLKSKYYCSLWLFVMIIIMYFFGYL